VTAIAARGLRKALTMAEVKKTPLQAQARQAGSG
jgi:hypothetical protein